VKIDPAVLRKGQQLRRHECAIGHDRAALRLKLAQQGRDVRLPQRPGSEDRQAELIGAPT
jgi:hypothetical protein